MKNKEMLCFHSTKEGFKEPSLCCSRGRASSFHSTKEGFKGDAGRASQRERGVSIPPRKVSRMKHEKNKFFINMFPFHQGRFQGQRQGGNKYPLVPGFHSTKEGFKAGERESGACDARMFPFHQGRFQGSGPPDPRQSRRKVSIPPRKVSRLGLFCAVGDSKVRFHSTKEGFKVRARSVYFTRIRLFPFHQGRFQGEVSPYRP